MAGLGGGQKTRGVAELAGQTQSVLVLVGRAVLFVGVAALALNTRDLT